MKQLHPNAVWSFFLTYFLVVSMVMVPFAVPFSLAPKDELYEEMPYVFAFFVENWVWVAYLPLVLLGYVWAQLSYKYYKYELRQDGFRKEYGVISKRYVTIPYERIQNVDIIRNPVSRILGLSDLQVQTAGMSGVALVEGRLPAIDPQEAEKLRDELIKRARKGGSQGL
jgi:uncharacterized membrane protein YdbT with pleckstrin-like domain